MKEIVMLFVYIGIGCALGYAWAMAEAVWQALCSYINDCEEDKHNEELDSLEGELQEELDKAKQGLIETRGETCPENRALR